MQLICTLDASWRERGGGKEEGGRGCGGKSVEEATRTLRDVLQVRKCKWAEKWAKMLVGLNENADEQE